MNFYERIEKLRKEKNISQKDLEIELGFSNGSISKWKKSKPTPERLQKLANFFDVSLEYLVNGGERNIDYVIRKESSETDPEVLSLIELYENASPDRRRLARIALGSPEQEP